MGIKKCIFTILVVLFVCCCQKVQDDKLIGDTSQKNEMIPEVLTDALLKEALSKEYWNGFPYKKSRELGTASIPYLIQYLEEINEERDWYKAVLALGHIGSKDTYEVLRSKMDTPPGEMRRDQYILKRDILIAMGCLASSGSDKAYRYIADGALPWNWEHRGWSFGNNDIGIELAKASISAISVTNRENARNILEQTKWKIIKREDLSTMNRRQLYDQLNTAFKGIEKIKKMSRQDYFDNKP